MGPPFFRPIPPKTIVRVVIDDDKNLTCGMRRLRVSSPHPHRSQAPLPVRPVVIRPAPRKPGKDWEKEVDTAFSDAVTVD